VYAALGLRCGDKIQIIETVVSPFHPDAVVNDVGAMLPICRSASGMAAISALPEQEVSPLFAKLEGYYGPRWTSLQHRIESKRREYHQSGYCTSVADLSANVGAVAIPILPTRSGDIFVLACGMQAREFHADRVTQLIAPRMLETAQYFRDALSH
jgi:DNA-binding IclR family transcriptional regulator